MSVAVTEELRTLVIEEAQGGTYTTTQPKLRDSETGITFDPLVVTNLSGILPWDLERDKTLCGENIVDTDGDLNARMTIEGYCLLSQLGELFQLRNNSSEVRLLWSGAEETGISSVSFDQLRFDRTAEEDLGEAADQITEPIFSFQLQSKEDGQDN